ESDAVKASKAKSKEKESEPEPETVDSLEVQETESEAVEEPETVEEPVAREEPVEVIAPEAEEPADEASAPTNNDQPPPETAEEQAPDSATRNKPGFSKLLDNLAGLTGFYGHGYTVESGTPS